MDEKFSIFTLFPSEQIVAGEEYGSYLSIMLIVAFIRIWPYSEQEKVLLFLGSRKCSVF